MAPTANPALTRDQTSAMFGPVMGLVALTLGCTALGAYIGRHFSGGSGLLFIIVLFGCVIGLQAASARGHQQLATVLLFSLGLALAILTLGSLVWLTHRRAPPKLPNVAPTEQRVR